MGFAQRCFQWTAAVVAALATLPTALAQSSSEAATENSASTLEEVVVYGQRASLEKAAEVKKDADQVVDAIVAEDIGKFPDVSTAAALQRVPGVQVTVGDNNEIVNPIIRGLGDILTTLDRREIFTGTGRGFAFQDLPAEALAEADVYKSSSADLIEGGVAGTINLKLHKAFDFDKPTFAFNGRVTREQNSGNVQSERWIPGRRPLANRGGRDWRPPRRLMAGHTVQPPDCFRLRPAQHEPRASGRRERSGAHLRGRPESIRKIPAATGEYVPAVAGVPDASTLY